MLFRAQVLLISELINLCLQLGSVRGDLRLAPCLSRLHCLLREQHKRNIDITPGAVQAYPKLLRRLIALEWTKYLSEMLQSQVLLGLLELLHHERGQLLRTQFVGQRQDIGVEDQLVTRPVIVQASRVRILANLPGIAESVGVEEEEGGRHNIPRLREVELVGVGARRAHATDRSYGAAGG